MSSRKLNSITSRLNISQYLEIENSQYKMTVDLADTQQNTRDLYRSVHQSGTPPAAAVCAVIWAGAGTNVGVVVKVVVMVSTTVLCHCAVCGVRLAVCLAGCCVCLAVTLHRLDIALVYPIRDVFEGTLHGGHQGLDRLQLRR